MRATMNRGATAPLTSIKSLLHPQRMNHPRAKHATSNERSPGGCGERG